VLLNKVDCRARLLEARRALKLIAVAGTGTDNIDLAAARERGIGVCNVRGYCTASVVQHVGLILSLTQHLSGYTGSPRRFVGRNEARTAARHPIRELNGRVFGIVGWGELGRAVARSRPKASACGSSIANRPGQRGRPASGSPLDELLATADIVSLHCPLTPRPAA
jgi:glycerate dehydrogenase